MPHKSAVSVIRFHFIQHSGYPASRRQLKAFLLSIFKKEKMALGSLKYIFCSDEYLLRINQQFLQHNYYTDIISFNLAEKNEPVEGEIYISLDRVRDNAKKLAEDYNTELHRVIFHGALHLCGYKDKSTKDARIIRKKENDYLLQYFK